MRWILLKIANLIIVLLIVTFIVAAIFTGPLAERQKQEIISTVRKGAIQEFKDVTSEVIVRRCVNSIRDKEILGFTGKEYLQQVILNSTTINVYNNTYFSKFSESQRGEIINIISNEVLKSFMNQNIVGYKKFINVTTSNIMKNDTIIELNVSKNEIIKIVSNIYSDIGSRCRNAIIDYRIKLEMHTNGLDRPWYELAVTYTKNLITFKEMNASQLTTYYWPTNGNSNALYIILERVPYSVLLFTTSSILTLLISIPLALLAAKKPGNMIDNAITSWSIISVSMPWWWLAMVFIYIFTIKTHIFQSPYTSKHVDWRNIKDVASMALLPVFTVTILSIGSVSYRLRNILLDVFNEDFVTVGRAKGLPERIILRKYIIRVAAPPIVTIVLFDILMSVFSGAIITELIFNWFGIGRLYWDAILANDVPVIVELTYITTLLYLIIRFILDILYTYLDPRIRRA